MMMLVTIIILIILEYSIGEFDIPSKSGSSTTRVIERWENITKPPYDRRLYRGLKLSNEMKVVLVSDPSAEKCDVAMVVEVGSLNDFHDVPGISNLVMWMILVSGESPRTWNRFYDTMKSRGGRVRIHQGFDHQIFTFQVNPNYLADSLKSFAEFFQRPHLSATLTRSVLEVIVNELHQHYLGNAEDDSSRILEVEKLLLNTNHPYNHLHCGNKETFYQHAKDLPQGQGKRRFDPKKKSLADKILQFYSLWYSSNIMNLTVTAKASLDELENMVVLLFKNVANKNVKKIIYPFEFHPWGPDQAKNRIYIVPLLERTNLLRLDFPVADIRVHYKTAPDLFVINLLTQKGPGSLFSVLRERNLCSSLEVEINAMAGFGFCTISCALCENDVKYVDDIITLVFQYIRLFEDKSALERIFSDFRRIREIAFDAYRPEDLHDSSSYTVALAEDMQLYPMEHILTHHYFLHPWDPAPVEQFLGYLKPDVMNVTFISTSIAEIAKQKEEHYGTKYEIEKMPDELIEKWKNVQPIAEFYLPPINEFIPKTFELYPVDMEEPKYPHMIHKSSISEVWFKQDDEFKLPEIYMELEIFCKITQFGPFERSLWYLALDHLFNPLMKENFYSATLVQFKIDSQSTDYGMRMQLSGFSDTFPILLEKVLAKLTTFENVINEENFNAVREKFIRLFSDAITKNHVFQVEWYIEFSQIQGSWMVQDNLNAAKRLQYNDMKEFLQKAFKRVFIRSLIYGNCTKKNAIEIINIIEKSFHSSHGMLPQEVFRPRQVELTDGSNVIFQTFNSERDIYGYGTYFQFNTELTSSNHVTAYLFCTLVTHPCAKILAENREDEIMEATCNLVDAFGVRGFHIVVRAPKHPRALEFAVKKFLRKVPAILKNTTLERFKNLKDDVIAVVYSDATPSERFERYWYEIRNRYYKFDRRETEIEQLRSLEMADLMNFFDEMMGAASPRRRKLTVHVFPEDSKSVEEKNILKGATKFDELTNFQNSVNLLPVDFGV